MKIDPEARKNFRDKAAQAQALLEELALFKADGQNGVTHERAAELSVKMQDVKVQGAFMMTQYLMGNESLLRQYEGFVLERLAAMEKKDGGTARTRDMRENMDAAMSAEVMTNIPVVAAGLAAYMFTAGLAHEAEIADLMGKLKILALMKVMEQNADSVLKLAVGVAEQVAFPFFYLGAMSVVSQILTDDKE